MNTNQNSPVLIQSELKFVGALCSARRSKQSYSDARRASRPGKPNAGVVVCPEAPGLEHSLGDFSRPPHPSASAESHSPKAKIFVVGDMTFFLGMEKTIDLEPDLTVCGKSCPSEAVAAIANAKPDAVVMDISDPGHLHAIKTIVKQWPTLPILGYSAFYGSIFHERVLRSGAKGCVSKQQPLEDFSKSLREVLHGHLSVLGDVKQKLLRKAISGKQPKESVFDSLSDRELEVLFSIGQGRGTRQIAKDTGLSIKTIESHRAHLKVKLQVKTAPELVYTAVKWVLTLY